MSTPLWATIDGGLRFFGDYEHLKDHLTKSREEGIRAHVTEVAYMREESTMKLWQSKWELEDGTLIFYDDASSEVREHHEGFPSEREWARGIDCD